MSTRSHDQRGYYQAPIKTVKWKTRLMENGWGRLQNVSSRGFALVISRALAGREVRFEVSGEEPERAFNRWTRHRNEIAKALPFVESEDLAELLEDRLAALPLLNFLQQ